MCTVAWRADPSASALDLLAIRDEFLDRPTDPVDTWWPDRSVRLVGARDRQAGGTALAMDVEDGRVAVLVNAPGKATSAPIASRGWLPLEWMREYAPWPEFFPNHPGFHLLTITRGVVAVQTWDGTQLVATETTLGEHVLTFPGLDARQHERGQAVVAALRRTGHDDPPWKWSDALNHGRVRPHRYLNRLYGTVGVTAIRWRRGGWRALQLASGGQWTLVAQGGHT